MNNHKYQRATSKITKEPKQKSRLGTASNKNYWGGGGGGGGGLELVCGRPTLALASVLVHQTQQLRTRKTKRIKHKRIAKWAAGIGGQVATMLELHTRQVDTTAIKRARKNEKEQLRGDKAEVPPWDGQQ